MGCIDTGESVISLFKSLLTFQPYVEKLVQRDVLTDRDLDIKRLKPFRLTAKRMELARSKDSNLKWCFGTLQQIERMARAMGSLVSDQFLS